MHCDVSVVLTTEIYSMSLELCGGNMDQRTEAHRGRGLPGNLDQRTEVHHGRRITHKRPSLLLLKSWEKKTTKKKETKIDTGTKCVKYWS
ncbi:16129_t:CDS:2 [Racocetra persica]|uniref:16129_t:CDS:1 n=1 Tax=Racocetra persica TaxID=160502 RepID=A0ACA9QP02_9GLOM|nr:16129_t:CDS:2 [Racocetra persica]